MDTIRVFRVILYEGPRTAVEALLQRSLKGTTEYGGVIIKTAVLGECPEVIGEEEE